MKNDDKNHAKDAANEQYKLYLQENGEHGLYISPEDAVDEDSVMYRAYYAAVSALKGILNDMERQKKSGHRSPDHDEEDCCYKKSRPRHTEELAYERASNIIAFCGARGQGKTSAMLSFTEALSDNRSREKNDSEFWQEVNGYISYVYAPPPIDLTLLENGETLLEVILSEFLRYLENLNKRGRERDMSDDDAQRQVNHLYRSITNCLKKVRSFYKSNKNDGKATLDDLYQLGSDVRLATDLYQLIQDFFCLLRGNPEKSYLLVRLDDTDLQFERAYDILEEARKYLSLPNVIVVMATDLEQLRLCVMKRFHEELKDAFDNERKKWEYVQEASAKYLDKLIPSTHAIYLPTIRSFYDTGKEIILYRKKNPRSAQNEEPKKLGELQNYILRAIFEKTGLAFLKRYKSQDSRHRKGHIHHIIPTTLRGLTHLVRLLEKMPEPHEKPYLSTLDRSNQEAWQSSWMAYCENFVVWAQDTQKNLRKFEDYFLNDWCSSRLRRADWDMIREIRGDATPDHALRHMVFLLKELAQKENAPPMDMEGAGDYVLLNRLLKQREENAFSRKTYSFCFAVRTYFSILFHKIALQEQIDSLGEELEKICKGKEYSLFSFCYTRLQDFLAPQMLDAFKIQEELLHNLHAFGLELPQMPPIYWPIDTEVRNALFDPTKVFLLMGKAEATDIPVYVFLSGKFCFDTFSPEIAWYVDLLNYFYKGLSALYHGNFKHSQWKQMGEEQIQTLRMQSLSTFVCCNWDVQEKIRMSLTDLPEDTFALWKRCQKIKKRQSTPVGNINEDSVHFPLYIDAIYQHIFTYLQDRCAFKPMEFEDMQDVKQDEEGNIAFTKDYAPHFPQKLPSSFPLTDINPQLGVMMPMFALSDADDIMNTPLFDDEE